jgi:hypothetical protein
MSTETPAQATTVLDTPAPAATTTTPTTTTTTTPAVEATAPAITTTTPTTEGTVSAPVVAEKPVETAKAIPENWREIAANGDTKRLQQLQRYSDYNAFVNSAFSLKEKLSSGEYKRPLPKDATPEQVKEWRTENGLPESPEGYNIELANGMVPGEADKPILEDLKKFAFEKNLAPAQLNELTSWYYQKQDEVAKQQQVADVQFHEEAKDALMSEWGLKDYRQNLAAMTAMRDQMPQGLADRVLAGRTSDGKRIGDDPTFLKWFASVSREFNPSATVVGLEGSNTVESELESIRRMRREDPSKYDNDKQLQQRELQLLDAQLKTKARKG